MPASLRGRGQRAYITKSDLALADLRNDGGELKPEQARKFIQLMIKRSVLMPLITVVPMKANTREINKSRFDGTVLRPATSGTALTAAQRSKPTLGKTELSTQLFKAEINLSDEVLEDNIEGASFRNSIMTMIAEAVSRDMEDIIVNGDTTLDPTLSSRNLMLSQLDGIRVQAISNVVDFANNPLSRDLLTDMVKTMPTEYLKDKRKMRFLASPDCVTTYRNTLAARETVAGDRYLNEDVPITQSGIPLFEVPVFPEPPAERTDVILTNPKNIFLGIQRNIKIETDRDVSAGVDKIIVSLRFDVKYANEDEVVHGINVAP